jgi:hypothetical protein
MKKLFFLFFIIFLVAFVVFSYLFIDPGLIYIQVLFSNFQNNHRVIATLLFILFISIFFAVYLFFLYQIKTHSVTNKDFIILVCLTTAILLFAYPAMLSFDIFNYLATAKVAFFYHENPYIVMPIAFIHDPLLLFMHAANKTALYAPFWILLTGIPFVIGFGNFLLTLLAFKMLVTFFYLLTVILLWKITKDVFKTAVFALNPLIVIETLVSGHNDIVMMFLALISITYLYKHKRVKSPLFFLLSVGIKYATAILIPLYVVHRWKKLSKETFFFWTTISMYPIFFLSSFREEIYPWYAIWFLVPVSIIADNNFITWISLTFSFSLLLRYIPFMLLGTYFGPTPIIKILITFVPVVLVTILYWVQNIFSTNPNTKNPKNRKPMTEYRPA